MVLFSSLRSTRISVRIGRSLYTMNSARHANRPSRGRGDRGSRRGGFNDRNSNMPSVPSIQQVIPGAPVSIVLKMDQPTGREVQGTVSEVLTSGNHPRGIKVRLQDGRVGRVQRMATDNEAQIGSNGLSGLGRNGETLDENGGSRTPVPSPGSFMNRRYGDFRIDSPDEPPANELSLSDYVVVKKAKKGKNKANTKAEEDTSLQATPIPEVSSARLETVISKCPVCGNFEGDEAAVARHVNDHFD